MPTFDSFNNNQNNNDSSQVVYDFTDKKSKGTFLSKVFGMMFLCLLITTVVAAGLEFEGAVMDAEAVEHAADEVGGIALGYGVEVEFGVGVCLDKATVVDADRCTGGVTQFLECGIVGFTTFTETESPSLHKTTHPAVEGTAGVLVHI